MLRLGILGCAEIAYRRFMPAAQQVEDLKVITIAEKYAPEKLDKFCQTYQLEREESFDSVLNRSDIDAVYIPQPPSLHFEWAKKALEHGKHVFVEKPSTVSYAESAELVRIAQDNNLVLHENYMFQYHSQIEAIKKMISEGEIGDVRLYRADFGFPMRESNDFRFVKALGGGALLDAGGYTIKLATLFLGNNVKVKTACTLTLPGFEVDMFGNATLANEKGEVFQTSYGMDNDYRCTLNIWGSKGSLNTNRILTAPPDYEPLFEINNSEGRRIIKGSKDSHFMRSIEHFCDETVNQKSKQDMYTQILVQAKLLEEVKHESGL